MRATASLAFLPSSAAPLPPAVDKARQKRREELAAAKANVARLKAEWMESEIQRRAAMTDSQRERSYKNRANTAASRAKRYGCPGSHTWEDIRDLVEAQQGLCAGCHEHMRDVYHVDHIRELADGGSNDPSNLQLLCVPCNLKKGGKHRLAMTVYREIP